MGYWSWEGDVDACCVSLSRSAAGFDSDNSSIVLSHSTRTELSEAAPLGDYPRDEMVDLGGLEVRLDDGRYGVRSAQLRFLGWYGIHLP